MRITNTIFLLFLLALPASGHVLDKTSIRIGVGETETFTVSDQSGCRADLRAVAAQPNIATVSPTTTSFQVMRTYTVHGVSPGETHVTAYWDANDGYYCIDQGSARVEVTVTGAEPRIIVSTLPRGLAQESNVGGATESFRLANTGAGETSVTLTPSGDFFQVSPTTATIAPGRSQSFEITASARAPGFYRGSVAVSGAGVPPNLVVPVRLVAANRPSTPPRPRPLTNRIDVTGNTAIVTFTNDGPGTVRGVFFSDVPWIIPPEEVFQFDGNTTAQVQFGIDSSVRPPEISVAGSLGLQYLLSPGEIAKGAAAIEGAGASTGTSTTSVNVVSTSPPGSSPAAIPPLSAQEIALFAPGIGRIVGSVGLYISDLTMTSLLAEADLQNVRLYYTTGEASAALTSNIATVSSTLATPLGDLVKTVFNGDAQIGTLQVRTPDVADLSVTASIFNSSNPAGTFGTGIPIFRSDRSVQPGQDLVLTGLRKTDTSHTNVFIQETSGNASAARITWMAADGSSLGQRSVSLTPFSMEIVDQSVVPSGAVSAIVEHEPGAAGAFTAYATPVDRSSGDFWAVADWVRHYGANPTQPVVVPVAGHAPGANNTQFRTDVSIVNSGATAGSGTLTYRDTGGTTIDRIIDVPAGQTVAWEDVTESLFEIAGNTVGYLRFTPSSGTLRMTSRTYNLVPATGATYGTGVPALPLGAAIGAGQSRRFGGVDDASVTTINAGSPATFRSNVGLVEVGGQPVTIRATMHYTVPSALVTAFGTATKELTLQPGEFRQIQRISQDILGEFRASFGDLRNLQLDFEVIGGSGSVLLFVSTTDNGTGDSILRME